MKILVLNCGSSSIKFQLFNMANESVLAKGLFEKIGTKNAILTYQPTGRDKVKEVREVADHQAGINLMFQWLTDQKTGVIKSLGEIAGIGHRVVHGAEKFTASSLINDEILAKVEECCKFAPLHNPPNLKGIRVCQEALPKVPQVAVFDTAFHHSMPAKAYLYALPYEMYEKWGVRRYGFHGTSHRYVSAQAAEYLGKPLDKIKLITCHLGNGSSIAAVARGCSVDTSMGFTPLEGLIMGTRCGDLDPAVVLNVMEWEKLTPKQMDDLMNKKSGFIGLSGVSNDLRELMEKAEAGHERAKVTIEILCYRIKKYIGAYMAALGGVDAVVFTGGIGENAWKVREEVCRNMEWAGIVLDEAANRERKMEITKGKVKVLVIPTNEELTIARDTAEVLRAAKLGVEPKLSTCKEAAKA